MDEFKPLRPTRTRPWDRRLARHLLDRAGFGGDTAAVDELVALGPTAAVVRLVGYAPTPMPTVWPDYLTFTADPGAVPRGNQQRRQEVVKQLQRQMREAMGEVKAEWLQRMLTTPQPLEEKLTLFWSGLLTSEAEVVRSPTMMHRQNALLRANAKGSFRDLLLGISRDPAMLVYLDNATSRVGQPNENYARELLELYSLGIGNYTEQDVAEIARAFTGWTIQNRRGDGRNPPAFAFNERWHDGGQKTIFGETGNFDGAQVVDLILRQPSAAKYLATKLYRFFVTDEPGEQDQRVITALAGELWTTGFQLEPVLTTLFQSDAFYAERHLGAKIKSPVELVVGTMRRLGVTALPGERGHLLLVRALEQMGQSLMDPPNVAGWAGGKQWVSTSVLLARYNFLGTLLGALQRGEPLQLPATADTTALVQELSDLCLSAPLTPAQVQQLAQGVSTAAAVRSRAAGRDPRLLTALHLVLSTPNYQLC